MIDGSVPDEAPRRPRIKARLTLLLIGGAAIVGIVLMCAVVAVLIATRW